jgi:uncharacterized protein GlcG (DUF336 family)
MAIGFPNVTGHVDAAHTASALLYSVAGATTVINPSYSQLTGNGFNVLALGFTKQFGIASNAGSDSARLFAAANQTVVTTPTYVRLSDASTVTQVQGFPQVAAFGIQGAGDKAWLYDSSGDDSLLAQSNLAQLTTPTATYSVTNFDAVDAVHSSGNDGVLAGPTSFALTLSGLWQPAVAPVQPAAANGIPQITAAEVRVLLERAVAASSRTDAIIAVVDRGGHILGVRTESGLSAQITNDPTWKVFAIDGAVSLARTAAFFSNGDPTLDGGTVGPLTSRTVREISQSTITQREVESNPEITDPNSTQAGPGYVAPVGIGGSFPPNVMGTGSADLFGIEHTNRDPSYVPGASNIDQLTSYGVVSGLLPSASSRGIATLPGGIPLYKNGFLVGGIGVFFPGPSGYATYEQGYVPGSGQTDAQRTNTQLELTAEWMGLAATGGSSGAGATVGSIGGIPALPGYDLPFGQINLGGITLDGVGPNGPIQGVKTVLAVGATAGQSNPFVNGTDQRIDPGGDLYGNGQPVPTGWLIGPQAGVGISAAQVTTLVDQGISEANVVRAQIRLPLGTRAQMVFAVADSQGTIVGLYRMQDAAVFSVDVAVAKARNTAYYDSSSIQSVDVVPGLSPGVAFTNRTIRYLALPSFPEGTTGEEPGPFSILNDPGINPLTGDDVGSPLPASVYEQPTSSVYGYDSFLIGTNFRQPTNHPQNGIVFFPGSTPLYAGNIVIGGFGASGDGVDQDDLITYTGAAGLRAPDSVVHADQVFVRGVRLPYFTFPRNPTQ